MPNNDPILDLVTAMNRARESGQTDEEATVRNAKVAMMVALDEVCARNHKNENHGGVLDSLEVLEVLALNLGVSTRCQATACARDLNIPVELVLVSILSYVFQKLEIGVTTK